MERRAWARRYGSRGSILQTTHAAIDESYRSAVTPYMTSRGSWDWGDITPPHSLGIPASRLNCVSLQHYRVAKWRSRADPIALAPLAAIKYRYCNCMRSGMHTPTPTVHARTKSVHSLGHNDKNKSRACSSVCSAMPEFIVSLTPRRRVSTSGSGVR